MIWSQAASESEAQAVQCRQATCLVHLVLDQALVRLIVERVWWQLEIGLQQPPRLPQRQVAGGRRLGVSDEKGPVVQTTRVTPERTCGVPSCSRSGV